MKKSVFLFIICLGFIISVGFLLASIKTATIKNKSNIHFKGVNLVAPIKELKSNSLAEIANLNANYVSLIPYAFVNQEKATVSFDYEKQWWGEKSEGIKICIEKAHQNKLKVMLKPHLWINHGIYTGHLDFKTEVEWRNWEQDYENYTLSMAKIAQEKNVDLFCFGTELGNALEKRPKYWSALIKKIKSIYSGKLTYAANWDDFEKVSFWNQLDYIGIDAYFPLLSSTTPTIKELQKSWKVYIHKMELLHKKTKKDIIFTEFGYRNSDACTKEPWKEENFVENNQAQANAYSALFTSLYNKSWYKGGFVWKWYSDDYHKKQKIDFTPQGKPALEVLKKWYQ